MIDVKKLLDASRVEMSFADIKIDGTFVKNFREKHSLPTATLANIFGVTKKTVERWEDGKKKISGSSAVLFKVLDDNPDIIGQLYTVKIIDGPSKRKLEIPKEYMFERLTNGCAVKTQSPITKMFSGVPLEDIECPCCRQKRLYIADFGNGWNSEKYQVVCRDCDWRNPTGTISDYGEATSEFKFWLEAFELLEKPVEKVNEDLTLYFYPEGEWREKERKERENGDCD